MNVIKKYSRSVVELLATLSTGAVVKFFLSSFTVQVTNEGLVVDFSVVVVAATTGLTDSISFVAGLPFTDSKIEEIFNFV